MSVALEGNLIYHVVKMALHISENAALESISTARALHGNAITKRLPEWKGRSSGPLDCL